jgi:chromosome partitioning protein
MILLGLAEIAELFGVTRQVVANWKARKATFPKPVANLKSGPVWERDRVVAWARTENVALAEMSSTRTASEEAPRERRAVVAALMNMKGGVGKSTMTANFGWYAAYRHDLRVLLIDLDPQFNLSQYILGTRGYEELLAEQAPTIEVLFKDNKDGGKPKSLSEIVRVVAEWDDDSCIHIVPANLELAWTMRHATDRAHILRDYIEDIRDRYDLVTIDCAPTESILSTAAYLASDYIFIPVKPEYLSTIGLPLLLRSLQEFRTTYKNETAPDIGGIIFNDTGDTAEHGRAREDVREIAESEGWHIFENEVSHSNSYPAGARLGKPIFLTDNARAWKKAEFDQVAAEFLERVGL